MIDSRFQKVINNELKPFFARKLKESKEFDKRLSELIQQIADVTLRGGDRMRPYFCALGNQIAQNKLITHNPQLTTIMPVLLALELTHTFALIHDDIMDEADARRGGPTIHAHFTKNLRNDQLAVSLAILAGDLAYLWAEELFDQLSNSISRHSGKRVRQLAESASRIRATRNGFPNQVRDRLWTSQDDCVKQAKVLFNTMREETIHGQVRDVWGMNGELTAEILKLYDFKSGRYSVEKPLLIGATLGNADTAVLSQLSEYGRNIGIAFQIQDDILGVFGNEKTTGKSTSSDIAHGKWTILISEMYCRLDASNQKKVLDLFKRRNMTPSEIDWVKKQIGKTGALNDVEVMMQEYAGRALKNISKLPVAAQTELEKIAEFAVSRKM